MVSSEGLSESIVIVGHGASVRGKNLEIDSYGVVVRLKDEAWGNEWGRRCTYRMSSTETMQCMLGMKCEKYFAQPKKGYWSKEQEAAFRGSTDIELEIPLELFLRWNAVFKGLSQEKRWEVRNFSLGMFSIIVSAQFGKSIYLAGFDNLLNPGLLDYHKADRGKWVSRHDWIAENRMLPLVEKEYGVKIANCEPRMG